MLSSKAKRFSLAVMSIFLFTIMVGCAGMEFKSGVGFVPKELRDADRAIEAARMAGKDTECPTAFAEASGMRDYAYELQAQCNTPEAKKLAMQAKEKAGALCPPKAMMPKAPPPAKLPPTIPPPPPAAKVIEKMSLHVHFYKDTAKIYAEDYKQLNEAISFVKKYPAATAIIEGHTDSDGAEEYNEKLSLKRAEAVKKFFATKGGISESRMKAIGYGEYRPLKPNDTRWGKYWNRRVDVVIVSD